MKTDDLITALARGAGPVQPGAVGRRLAGAGLGGLALGAVVVLAVLGARPDLAGAPPGAFLKTGVVLVAIAVSARLALRAARPATRLAGAAAPALGALAASALASLLGLLAFAPAGEQLHALLPVAFPPCLWGVPLSAAPAFALALWAVRSLGPTRLAPAGAAAGALAGAVGALAYVLHCPIDSPAYVLFWYPLAIALCAALGAAVGPRVLRW